jgi:PST family polysaccharide transporter
MVPVMGLFGLSAALRASTAIATPLFNANSRVSLGLKYDAISTTMMVIGIWFAMPYGTTAVTMVIVVTSLYRLLPFRAALGLIGLQNRHVGQILGPPFLASLLLWLSITILRPYSFSWLANPGALLALHVFAGGAVYLIALHMLSRQYLVDFKDVIGRFLPRHR